MSEADFDFGGVDVAEIIRDSLEPSTNGAEPHAGATWYLDAAELLAEPDPGPTPQPFIEPLPEY